MRLKTRNRLAKKTGAAFAALAAVALMAYGGYKARSLAAALQNLEIFAFTARTFSVKSPSGMISSEISGMLAPRTGRRFSASDAENLERALRARYPALSRVEVGRNFIGGRVTVKAEPEPVVAKVRLVPPGGGDRGMSPYSSPFMGEGGGGKKVVHLKSPSPSSPPVKGGGTGKEADRGKSPYSSPFTGEGGGGWYYLAENGRLLSEIYCPAPADAFETEIYAGPGENLAALARFLKELGGLKEEFSYQPVSLRCRSSEGSCLVTLKNSAEVFWGEFEFTRSKIARLNEVLEDAARKIKGPVKINFRYFRDGKVFVSKAGDI